ncbi:hypothetical protein C2S52_000676 [Perilla frutescens var. hirtella]|nr:hypothetical protein C2S52_000676 [Perilla frutescens var. hirtella]
MICTSTISLLGPRKPVKIVNTLSRNNGMFTTSLNQVTGEFVGYFMNLFGSHAPFQQLDLHILTHGRILTIEAQHRSSRPIFDRDIKAALFAIRDDKAPGPGDFSAVFFKKSWNIVRPSICAAVHEFLLHGRLLK